MDDGKWGQEYSVFYETHVQDFLQNTESAVEEQPLLLQGIILKQIKVCNHLYFNNLLRLN